MSDHTWTPPHATLHVHTRREGVLSPVGHDLRLVLRRFELRASADGAKVQGRFEMATLEVEAALDGDRPAARPLARRDQRKIEDKARSDVLAVRRYPYGRLDGSASLPSADGPGTFEGTLELLGRERPVRASLRRVGDRLEARATLLTPDYGIKPITALFGALKVRPDVEVIVSVPAP